MWEMEKVLAWTAKIGITLLMFLLSRQSTSQSARRVQIVVLGDIGRSPRMQYHALSIAKRGYHVDLIGYLESSPHSEILTAQNIHLHSLAASPAFLKTQRTVLFLLYGPLKVVLQIFTLVVALGWKTQPSRWILVQTPPSIPTLYTAYVICILRGSKLIIDWHNFGYSILALKIGKTHPLVRISYVYEWVFARCASEHFCVTEAMARILRQKYAIRAPIMTLHDRPAAVFQVIDRTQRSTFLKRLPGLLVDAEIGKGDFYRDPKDLAAGKELQKLEAIVESVHQGATKLIVSATSWTPDEDFSILLDALLKYTEIVKHDHNSSPELFVIITGKGPQKAGFEEQVKKLTTQRKLEFATIRTAYFDDVADYANLLGSANLGISLHTSSSGVDLPMKVVDMFGAGLPVAGWGDYQAWPELVKENINGMGFKDAAGLASILATLFLKSSQVLTKLKEGALQECKWRWDDEWDTVAGNLFGPLPPM